MSVGFCAFACNSGGAFVCTDGVVFAFTDTGAFASKMHWAS